MIRNIVVLAIVIAMCQVSFAQRPGRRGNPPPAPSNGSAEERLMEYVAVFNKHDAEALGAFWAEDGVSIAEETGQRTQGREALQSEFAAFFKDNPGAHLTGEITNTHPIRPDVIMLEGMTTLFIADAEPVQSAFTAILVKEGDQWLISSSQERDLPTPETPYDALKELEWLVGVWEDQSDAARVTTTVRWSPNRTYLIRSFLAQFEEGEALQGTQIIGWDPLNKQIRAWTFNSDGTFGEGTLARHDDEWHLKMWQILPEGQLATATKVMSRVDDQTISIDTIGETIDGAPVPSSEPVTVVRTGDAGDISRDDAAVNLNGATP